MPRENYSVVGSRALGYAVKHRKGYIEYDLLESKVVAVLICQILNRGIGPEWDKICDEIDRITSPSRRMRGNTDAKK